MGKRMSIPLSLGGMVAAGDAATIPDGSVRLLQNYLPRPNRFPARPPFAYDSLMAINGLANWDDQTNKVSRLIAVNASHQVFTKSATSGVETWSAANGTTIGGTRITDFVNYRGKLYAMVDDGAGLPSAAFSYDGTNVSTAPFNSTIAARTVSTFGDRLFMAYPRVTFTNAIQTIGAAYDWTSNFSFSATNCTRSNLTISGGKTVCRVFPTSTAANACQISDKAGSAIAVVLSDSSSDQFYMLRHDLTPVDPAYQLPITYEVYMDQSGGMGGTHAFVVGELLPRSGVQRCTTAGTVTNLSVEPAWNATLGGTTVWEGATFTNISSATLGSVETSLPTATAAKGTATTIFVPITVPWGNVSWSGQIGLSVRIKLYNSNTPALTTLAPFDLSLKDGLADGDPRKANRGLQITKGDFAYPFFNQESSLTATIDMPEVVWSEIANPAAVRAVNTQKIPDAVGFATASCTIGKRLLVFKRTAFFQFQDTGDPDVPIRQDSSDTSIGCLGPRALDTMEDEVFFIGEQDIYRCRVGSGKPTPICGDGMRETIMSKGSGWVESQSTYKRPLLAIDKSKLIVWVYTQMGKLYAYDLRAQVWSVHLVSTGIELDAMLWNSNTGNMYMAWASGTYGLSRMDYATGGTAGANDQIDNTVNTYAGDISVILRPIELSAPGRFDATSEFVNMLHASRASGQTITASYSFDQGQTFTKSAAVTLSSLSLAGEFLPLRIVAWETAPSVTVKLGVSGKLGEFAWSLSPRFNVDLNIRRGEYQQSNPTAGATNL